MPNQSLISLVVERYGSLFSGHARAGLQAFVHEAALRLFRGALA